MSIQQSTPEKLMTVAEVAEYLQVKERTVYQWAQAGKIPGFKLGNIWRFEQNDIQHWIKEQKQSTSRYDRKKNNRIGELNYGKQGYRD